MFYSFIFFFKIIGAATAAPVAPLPTPLQSENTLTKNGGGGGEDRGPGIWERSSFGGWSKLKALDGPDPRQLSISDKRFHGFFLFVIRGN